MNRNENESFESIQKRVDCYKPDTRNEYFYYSLHSNKLESSKSTRMSMGWRTATTITRMKK